MSYREGVLTEEFAQKLNQYALKNGALFYIDIEDKIRICLEKGGYGIGCWFELDLINIETAIWHWFTSAIAALDAVYNS